jgi:hypothetical protein
VDFAPGQVVEVVLRSCHNVAIAVGIDIEGQAEAGAHVAHDETGDAIEMERGFIGAVLVLDGMAGGADVLVVEMGLGVHILDGGVVGDVGNEEGMHLGGRCGRDEQSYALHGDRVQDHLHLEGGLEVVLALD